MLKSRIPLLDEPLIWRGRRISLLAWSLACCIAGLAVGPTAAEAEGHRKLIIVVGAHGTAEYRASFAKWADNWQRVAEQSSVDVVRLGDPPAGDGGNDRMKLQAALESAKQESLHELWLVFIGHGTFDGEAAKFNLYGPDVTATQLAQWIEDAARTTIVINCASSSAPFINKLSAPNRIIVTSTKSGLQYNFSRFGEFLSNAITAEGIDLDKDNQVSLLEAFVAASAQTAEFYSSKSRLATEHALLEDNADGRGTPGDWFRGTRTVKRSQDGAAADGLRANQVFLVRSPDGPVWSDANRQKRDRLEQQLEKLRQIKPDISEDQYYLRLEELMLQLSRLYAETDKSVPADSAR